MLTGSHRPREEAFLTGLFRHSDSAICEPIEDGAVALHLETGDYYEIDGVGLWIWERCALGSNGHSLAGELGERYGLPRDVALSDTSRFLSELLDAKLVERVDPSASQV